MHNLAWLSAAATRACLCFSGAWHQSSLCLRCAAAMCVITFGSLGERFGAWGYARAWRSLSAKYLWCAAVIKEDRTLLNLWCLPENSEIADKCIFARSEWGCALQHETLRVRGKSHVLTVSPWHGFTGADCSGLQLRLLFQQLIL